MSTNSLAFDVAERRECSFPPGPRPARYTALHFGTALLHGGALASLAVAPAAWPWALGAVAANHLFNAAQSLFPTSRLLGPALIRLPQFFAQRGAVALTFDDGPDPDVTPFALDQLDRAGARATFFCVGEQVRKYPALAREIVARGHAVENHSYLHTPFAGLWSPWRWRRDIEGAQAAIADATGIPPRFFRPPFGVRTPLLEPALARVGLHCVVWSARGYDTIARDARRVVKRIAPGLLPGAIVLLHDGMAVRERDRPALLLEALPRLLGIIRERGMHSISLRTLIESA